MNCNTGQRKVFAEDVVQVIDELCKKYNLADIVVERHDPMLIAVRGCLGGDNGKEESLEMLVQLSGNLRQAEIASTQAVDINQQMPVAGAAQVFKSFDLSQIVAKDTEAAAATIEPKVICDKK